MGEPAVELKNVTKRFGDVVAVDDISMHIEDGEFFSLLGPSGCGKTTTLRIIAGLETVSEGSVSIHGREMGRTPPFKRPVNTVFQNYALFPHMTVDKNVAFGLKMSGVSRREIPRMVAEALEMVQLPGMGKRRPTQLSGGQQQRVALARALVNRPEVLLLDEPLGALDLKLRKAMQFELKELQRQVGITFIYVTHDQEEALTMSDRIAVMFSGKVLQIGKPKDIYEHPQTRFVADFIGETNFLDGTVDTVDNNNIRVRIGDDLFINATSDDTLTKGMEVSVVIRPEKVSLSDEGMLSGQIEEIIYIGTDTRYIVRLPNDAVLTVRDQNLDLTSGRQYAIGDQVGLKWNPDRALVLSE